MEGTYVLHEHLFGVKDSETACRKRSIPPTGDGEGSVAPTGARDAARSPPMPALPASAAAACPRKPTEVVMFRDAERTSVGCRRALPPRFGERPEQRRCCSAPGRPARARSVQGCHRRDPRSLDDDSSQDAAAQGADRGRRPPRPGDAACARPFRTAPLWLAAAPPRDSRLGRRCFAVQACVARVPVRRLRRRLRAAHETRAAPLPGLGRPARGWNRRARHARRARRTAGRSDAPAFVARADPALARAGTSSTPASTSSPRPRRPCTRRVPAKSSLRAGRTGATDSSSSSHTAEASARGTRTSRGSTSAAACWSTRESASASSAPPATRRGRTSISRCESEAL